VRFKFRFIFGLIILTVSLLVYPASAENDLNFDLPVPAGSRLLDSKQLNLGDRQIDTSLFNSQMPSASAVEFYLDFFGRNDFEKILDKTYADSGKRLLRFKKDSLVITVSITEKGGDTEIVTAKYLQGPNELSPEETRSSLKDSIFSFPESDVEGSDIPGLPRPSPSVRVMSVKTGKILSAMYTTPLDVSSVVDFYRAHMPDHNWQFRGEIGAADAAQAYMKASGKDSLGLKSPLSGGEDLEQVVKDSYVLNFASGSESAEIIIFPNFSSRKLGSIVQVSYSQQGQ
jgi:hypothetical protein